MTDENLTALSRVEGYVRKDGTHVDGYDKRGGPLSRVKNAFRKDRSPAAPAPQKMSDEELKTKAEAARVSQEHNDRLNFLEKTNPAKRWAELPDFSKKAAEKALVDSTTSNKDLMDDDTHHANEADKALLTRLRSGNLSDADYRKLLGLLRGLSHDEGEKKAQWYADKAAGRKRQGFYPPGSKADPQYD